MEDHLTIIKGLQKVPNGIRAFKRGACAFIDGVAIEANPFAKLDMAYSHLVTPWNQGYEMAKELFVSKRK